MVDLARIQHWLMTIMNGLLTLWQDPKYFCEEAAYEVSFFLEDYFFCSPIFWALFHMLYMYLAIKIALYLQRDYLHFLSLGRGGRPSTVLGWLQTKLYQFLFCIIKVDVLSTPFVDPLSEPYNGLFESYPIYILPRGRPRPEMIGMDPMRQSIDGNPAVEQWVRSRFVALGRMDPEAFRYQTSYLTGLPALRRNLPEAPPNGTPNAVTEWGGEIAHVRPDGSTTICLHPDDADLLIQLGWGQRSPLAVMDETWLWKFIHHKILRTHTPLPHNMVTIYAPLHEGERFTFNLIMCAAVWWAYAQGPLVGEL